MLCETTGARAAAGIRASLLACREFSAPTAALHRFASAAARRAHSCNKFPSWLKFSSPARKVSQLFPAVRFARRHEPAILWRDESHNSDRPEPPVQDLA